MTDEGKRTLDLFVRNFPLSKFPSIMIRDLKQKLKYRISGIYFIFDRDDKLIYVGETLCIRRRIMQHKRALKNDYENQVYRDAHYFKYIQFRYTQEDLEGAFIRKYKPKYNKMGRW